MSEVIGPDREPRKPFHPRLAQPLDETAFAQIRSAFYQYEVICFRGQALSDEDQIRLSARSAEMACGFAR